MKNKIFFFFLVLTMSSLSFSKALILNGTGYRKATIFNIKVYKAELFLEEKESDAKKIIHSSKNKKLVLSLLRDVDKTKFTDGLIEGLKKNTKNIPQIKEQVNTFNNQISDLKNGDHLEINFIGRNQVNLKNTQGKVTTLLGETFSQTLLKVWLGNPPNEDLKKGLLGTI